MAWGEPGVAACTHSPATPCPAQAANHKVKGKRPRNTYLSTRLKHCHVQHATTTLPSPPHSPALPHSAKPVCVDLSKSQAPTEHTARLFTPTPAPQALGSCSLGPFLNSPPTQNAHTSCPPKFQQPLAHHHPFHPLTLWPLPHTHTHACAHASHPGPLQPLPPPLLPPPPYLPLTQVPAARLCTAASDLPLEGTAHQAVNVGHRGDSTQGYVCVHVWRDNQHRARRVKKGCEHSAQAGRACRTSRSSCAC